MSSSKSHRHGSRDHKSSKSSSRGSGSHSSTASISVEPPNQASINTLFYPPVVARARISGANAANQGYTYVFAMAVLLDASGSVLEGQLGGNTVTTGVTLSEESGGSGVGSSSRSGSSSSSYLYFAFPDLFVLYSGNYSIRVDIHLVDYQDAAQGARLLAQAETRSFTVYDEYVAVEKPVTDERRILQRLRDQGCAIPATPAQ